jgi:hypothetical protein
VSGDRPVPRPRSSLTRASGQETVTELAARLKDLRAQRLDDEAEAAQLPTLLRAILLSRQDRDAGSSPTLSEHRAHLERIWSDLEDLVATTARVAVRMHLHDADAADPLLRRAQRAIEHSRVALREFAEAVNQA